MDVCNNVVNKIVNCVISSNQVTWFLNIKNLGGFINNIDNPKLHALHNHINPEISKILLFGCCIVALKIPVLNDLGTIMRPQTSTM